MVSNTEFYSNVYFSIKKGAAIDEQSPVPPHTGKPLFMDAENAAFTFD